MRRILAWTVAAFLGACGQLSQTAAPEALGGRWIVQEIASQGVATNGAVWMAVDAPSGRVEGETGCNAFTAEIRSFGQSISITSIVETQGACASVALEIDETRLLRVLPAVGRFIRHGRRLELLTQEPGSEPLVLARLED